ncbi:MAG: hypothetical protein L3J45_00005 [Flavobacteriaceae bacterium]|nr:hypothetical protein [Flavobacteriaceae bacterium]
MTHAIRIKALKSVLNDLNTKIKRLKMQFLISFLLLVVERLFCYGLKLCKQPEVLPVIIGLYMVFTLFRGLYLYDKKKKIGLLIKKLEAEDRFKFSKN